MTKEQAQSSGSESMNIQAAGSVYVEQSQGTRLTYRDVREIAQDLFEKNFLELTGSSYELAKSRAAELRELFVRVLQDVNPDGVGAAKDPDMQYALYSAQVSYARSGEEELGKALVDLLVERTKESADSLRRVVLNESIEVAPKLTRGHLAMLSLIMVLRYSRVTNLPASREALQSFLGRSVMPYVDEIEEVRPVDLQHLEYVGCASEQISVAPLMQVIRQTYPGWTCGGFVRSTLHSDLEPYADRILKESWLRPGLVQVLLSGQQDVTDWLGQIGVPAELEQQVTAHMSQNPLPDPELQELFTEVNSGFQRALRLWDAGLSRCTLTSVGMALARANSRRTTGDVSPLSIWIP